MAPARGRIVALDGLSGAGKSTLVARATEELGWVALAEAYDRIHPRPRLDVRTPRRLRSLELAFLNEEARRWQAARSLAGRGATVLADTGFLGPLTYTAGLVRLGAAPVGLLSELTGRARRLARDGRWGLPDLEVYLGTDAATRRRRRRADPGRHPPALARRHETVGRLEEEYFRHVLAPRLPGRVVWIDGGGSVARSLARLRRAVDGLRSLARPAEKAVGATAPLLDFARAAAAPARPRGNR